MAELVQDVKIAHDNGPEGVRIGLVALSNDHVIERDLAQMCRTLDVLVFTSRLHFSDTLTLDTLQAMAPLISDAAALLLPESPMDAVLYGCTSGTAAIGHDAVVASLKATRPAHAYVTPVAGACAAFAALGAERIAVFTPYLGDVAAPIVDAFAASGPEIVGVTNLGIEASRNISKVTPETIFECGRRADDDRADALFISCTDFRSLDVVDTLEREIGKPVVTSNQAMLWQALLAVGSAAAPQGFGRLWQLGAAT